MAVSFTSTDMVTRTINSTIIRTIVRTISSTISAGFTNTPGWHGGRL